MTSFMAQAVAVTRTGVKSIPARLGSCAAAVLGIAGVVAVLVGVLSIARGFARTLERSGAPDAALVLRAGATDEMVSGLSSDDVKVVADAPGVARGDSGPLASGELFVIIDVAKKSTGTDANVPLRGVQTAAFAVRPEFVIAAGRSFEWGRNEVIVGRGAAAEFAGLELGATIEIAQQPWAVVGHFATGGGVAESEIWTDAAVLQPAYRRGTSFQSVAVRLESAAAFTTFKDALTTDPRVSVKVLRQSDYYAEQSQILVKLVTGLGTLVASLMALGAVFGALNTMYTAVAERSREVATFRAIGFNAAPVVVSVLLESLLLAVLGGAIGGGAAWLAFDGYRTSTLNWASFSQVAFAFDVTPGLLVQGTVYAALIGLVGGLFPAIRASRIPVAVALREP